MTMHQPISLTLDRTLLEHPEGVHLRRMRMALWLYLVLLGRLPQGNDALEVNPASLGLAMGLPEGAIRSWLGHLRQGGYVATERRNGGIRITMKKVALPPKERSTEHLRPLFTVPRLIRALGEKQDADALAHAIAQYPPEVIRRALAGTLAVPDDKIRRSRTALFLYLLKRYEER